MARKVLVRLVDDLDGMPSEDVATVTFSLDRVTYQIDLNESNATKLRDGLASYVAAARRTGGRVRRGAPGRAAGTGNDGPAIREWARENGHDLAERGRIPSHIVDAFHTATRSGRSKAPAAVTAAVRPTRTRKAAAQPAPARSTKTAAASRTATKATAKATPKAATRGKAAASSSAASASNKGRAKSVAAKSTAKAPRSAASTAARGARRASTKKS